MPRYRWRNRKWKDDSGNSGEKIAKNDKSGVLPFSYRNICLRAVSARTEKLLLLLNPDVSRRSSEKFHLFIIRLTSVAKVTVAQRVAQEVGCSLGDKVGYSVRFDDKSSVKTRIKYLTVLYTTCTAVLLILYKGRHALA